MLYIKNQSAKTEVVYNLHIDVHKRILFLFLLICGSNVILDTFQEVQNMIRSYILTRNLKNTTLFLLYFYPVHTYLVMKVQLFVNLGAKVLPFHFTTQRLRVNCQHVSVSSTMPVLICLGHIYWQRRVVNLEAARLFVGDSHNQPMGCCECTAEGVLHFLLKE